MDDFLLNIEMDKVRELEFELNGQQKNASILKLFTHVITHEFHHKGQIISLKRHLGYIPAVTDILR